MTPDINNLNGTRQKNTSRHPKATAGSVLITLLFATMSISTAGGSDSIDTDARPQYDLSRVVIGFHDLPTELPEFIVESGGTIDMIHNDLDFVVVQDAPNDGAQLIKAALADSDVRYAEHDQYMYTMHTPNDVLYPRQWHLPAVRLNDAWDVTFGSHDIDIHILDTGIDPAHLDLVDNMVTCPFPAGVNAMTYPVVTAGGSDSGFHGTHVAGIAGAVIDNDRLGVAGASQSCITSVRVLAGAAGLSTWAAAGIDWSWRNGAEIISMSFGSEVSSSAVEDAVEDAYDDGVLLIAAAGNDGCNADVGYPAAFDDVMAVASLKSQFSRSSFSTCGTEVEIAAPGSNIWSTLPGNLYGPLDGTSMATPLVSGIAALVMDQNQTLSHTEVRCILQETAVSSMPPGQSGDLDDPDQVGHGRVDAYDAVSNASNPSSIGC